MLAEGTPPGSALRTPRAAKPPKSYTKLHLDAPSVSPELDERGRVIFRVPIFEQGGRIMNVIMVPTQCPATLRVYGVLCVQYRAEPRYSLVEVSGLCATDLDLHERVVYCQECCRMYSKHNLKAHDDSRHRNPVSTIAELKQRFQDLLLQVAVKQGLPATFGSKPEFIEFFGQCAFSRPKYASQMAIVAKATTARLLDLMRDAPLVLGVDGWKFFGHELLGVMLFSPQYQCLIGLGEPERLARQAEDIEGYLRRVMEKFEVQHRVVTLAADGATVMSKTASLMGLPRVVCLMHLVNRAYGDARKVEPLASIVEKGGAAAGVLARSFKFVQYVRRTEPGDLDPDLRAALEAGGAARAGRRGGVTKVTTASITRVVDDVFVIEALWKLRGCILQFQRMRGGDGKPLTPKSYEALDEEFFGLVECVLDPLTELRAIVSELERAFVEQEAWVRCGTIFSAMGHILTIATGVCARFAGPFAAVGEALRSGLFDRLLKHESTLRMAIRGMHLNPTLSTEGLGEVHERFGEIAQEEEEALHAQTRCEARGGPAGTMWGRRLAEDADEFTAFQRVRVAERANITSFWQNQHQWPKLRAIALRLAAVPATTGDVERVFSTARATFDYYMGRLSPKELERRLMVKVNSRLLRRFAP